MRRSIVAALLCVGLCLIPAAWAQIARDSNSLQLNLPVERTIGRGQSHRFTVNMERDQILKLVVDQRGIDVVVRVYSNDGKILGEFDSPNGNQGPEKASLVSSSAGSYSIEVTPVGMAEDLAPGRYSIQLVELRQATDAELRAAKAPELLKAKGLALATDVADVLSEIRSPQNRIHAQIQAALILWNSNERLARRLLTEAMTGVQEYIAKADSADQDYYQTYSTSMQLRQELLQVLGPFDPEVALNFFRSTRTLINPNAGQNNGQSDQELRLELNLANQLAAKDPRRAFLIAEDTLTLGYSSGLNGVLSGLRDSDAGLAAQLSKETVAKLREEKFMLTTPDAANVAVSLLRLAHSPAPRNSKPGIPNALVDTPLLSDQDYQDLFSRTISAGLAFEPSPESPYSPEINSARNILNSLKSMTAEMQTFSPASITAADKKLVELNTPPNPQDRQRQKYQDAVNMGTVDAALEAIGLAPQDMRDSLYQQVAWKAASAGDLVRARQIAADGIVNPRIRQDALTNVERQAIQRAISQGRFEEALKSIANLRTSRDRTQLVSQSVNQLGNGQKKAAVLTFLEQAYGMLGVPPLPENQEQMSALLQISQAFSRYDSLRGFEILEPLLEQFNGLCASAVALNGFGQQYYRDGELIMQNGNPLGNFAGQLIPVLGRLALLDFDRAKADAERLQRPEIRAAAFLTIAQQAVSPQKR